ncbi:hypothetical protein [Streptomyces sp. NPDC004726]
MSRVRIRWPAVVARAREIVEGYDGGVTLRQVMYRLVSEGVLPHTPSMYRHLSSHLAKARREGNFPDLIDTLREVHVPPAWPDATAFLGEVVGWFGLERTQGQRPLYVAAEKDTLRQMFTTWLAEYGLPVLVVRGFASQSYADVVRRRTARQGRATLLRFGDFDASGAEIERDWVRGTADCRHRPLTREGPMPSTCTLLLPVVPDALDGLLELEDPLFLTLRNSLPGRAVQPGMPTQRRTVQS